MRTVPSVIGTDCERLNVAWREYAGAILGRPGVLIADTESDLNWRAFGLRRDALLTTTEAWQTGVPQAGPSASACDVRVWRCVARPRDPSRSRFGPVGTMTAEMQEGVAR